MANYYAELYNKSYPEYLQTLANEDAIAQNNKKQIAAVERMGNAIIASQIASTTVLNNTLGTLGYVTETGFRNLAGGMQSGFNAVSRHIGAVSRQIGEMGVAMDMGLARLETAVEKSANAICQKLDTISDTLKSPSLTKSREYLNRASANYNKGFFEEALEEVNECIKFNKVDYRAWFLQGKAYLFGAGEFSTVVDLSRAIDALEQAKKYITPDSREFSEARLLASEVLFYLALAKQTKAYSLLYEGNKEDTTNLLSEAAQQFSQSYTCSAKMLDAKYNEARCYASLGNTTEAIKIMNNLIKTDAAYSLKVARDPEFNRMQSAFEQLMKQLRRELYPNVDEIWTRCLDLRKKATELCLSVNPPKSIYDLKDMPYLDMLSFRSELIGFNHTLEQRIASQIEKIRIQKEEAKGRRREEAEREEAEARRMEEAERAEARRKIEVAEAAERDAKFKATVVLGIVTSAIIGGIGGIVLVMLLETLDAQMPEGVVIIIAILGAITGVIGFFITFFGDRGGGKVVFFSAITGIIFGIISAITDGDNLGDFIIRPIVCGVIGMGSGSIIGSIGGAIGWVLDKINLGARKANALSVICAILFLLGILLSPFQKKEFLDMVKSAPPKRVAKAIKDGANVKEEGILKTTPLHNAASLNASPEVIAALINAGADVNAKDAEGWIPLHYAAGNNQNPEIIAALIKAGANVNDSGDPARGNRRDYNVYYGDKVRAYIRRIDWQQSNSTPLHIAAALNKNPKVVAALVSAGANINAKDMDGNTPLQVAIIKRNTPAAQALRDAGAK
ncbi:hypothetical protein AGMMS49959_00210 [Planctomycetales bacterium]|nr:hypothetical protein AGMMS49959_00210 [Planctomycetales bacterium]